MTSQATQQANTSFLVHRTLQVPAMRCSKCIQTITDRLSTIEGMSDIDIDLKKKKVHLQYDVSKVLLSDIRKLLKEMGYPLSTRWWPKIRQAIYQYQDENIRGNAIAGDGACCNKPPSIHSRGGRNH